MAQSEFSREKVFVQSVLWGARRTINTWLEPTFDPQNSSGGALQSVGFSPGAAVRPLDRTRVMRTVERGESRCHHI